MTWSDEEVEELEQYYPTKPMDWLQDHFCKSRSAIGRKASRIGVSRHDQIQLIQSVRNAPEPHFPDDDYNNYIVGFVDGEGSFMSPDTGRENQEKFRFAIELVQEDAEVLEDLRSYLGVGYMHYMDKRQDNWSDHVTYYVTNYGEIVSVVIPFFDQNPPRAPKKSKQYQWWRDAVLNYTEFDIERFK